MSETVSLKLELMRETDNARLYRRSDGTEKWFPRSVIKKCLKWPAEGDKRPVHEIEVDEWFLTKNPWPDDQQEMKF